MPMVRLLVKTYEDIMLSFVELENSFRDKVANPG